LQGVGGRVSSYVYASAYADVCQRMLTYAGRQVLQGVGFLPLKKEKEKEGGEGVPLMWHEQLFVATEVIQ
jgi:hypothetical protein